MQQPFAIHTIASVQPVADGRSGPKLHSAARRSRRARAWLAAGTAVLALQAGTASGALGDVVTTKDKTKARSHTVFSCEPARFEGERHYVKVRMNGAMIASIHLLRADDGEEVGTAHPYGSARARVTEETRELCMRTERVERFVQRIERRQHGKPFLPRLPGARDADAAAPGAEETDPGSDPTAHCAATNTCNTGLSIGWTPSIGVTSGTCYNFATTAPSSVASSTGFSSSNTASSVSAQTKVSATVRGAFDVFDADASFSYSDQWLHSAHSGQVYFNLTSLWTLNNTLDTASPLNAEGLQAGDQFATQCGVNYLGTVVAGMVATLRIAYGSSSSSQTTQISEAFGAGDGLDSFHEAVENSKEVKDSAAWFKSKLFLSGGGGQVSSDILLAMAKDGYIIDCERGDPDACTDFYQSMNDGAAAATNAFQNIVNGVRPGSDLSNFELFPNGVAGATTDEASVDTPPNPQGDVLANYEGQLQTYMGLLNEIATLLNRAQRLSNLVGDDSFNPVPILDLQQYFDALLTTNQDNVSYATSRTILLDRLETCLNATRTNVEEVCDPIIDGGGTIESAYNWYGATDGYPECTNGDQNKEACWIAQQNAIALQYDAIFTMELSDAETNETQFSTSWPEDVVYIDRLPIFNGAGEPIKEKAGLATFTDATFFDPSHDFDKAARDTASVQLLPLANETDLREFRAANDPSLTFFWIWSGLSGNEEPSWAPGPGFTGAPFTWTQPDCEPTFEQPCAIGYRIDTFWPFFPFRWKLDLILTPIDNLFEPAG